MSNRNYTAEQNRRVEIDGVEWLYHGDVLGWIRIANPDTRMFEVATQMETKMLERLFAAHREIDTLRENARDALTILLRAGNGSINTTDQVTGETFLCGVTSKLEDCLT